MIDFGRAIKKYRVQERLTQKELATRVGITPSYLSSLEQNKKEPSVALLKNICDTLKLPYEIMFWESVVINNELTKEDKKIVELAKVILHHYLESRNASHGS